MKNLPKNSKIGLFKKITIIVIILSMFFGLAFVLFTDNMLSAEEEEDNEAYLINTLNDGSIKYTEFIKNNEDKIIDDYHKVFKYDDYKDQASNILNEVNDEVASYEDKYINLNSGDIYTFNLHVEKSGLYVLSFDYYLPSTSIIDTEVSMEINSDIQYYEQKQLQFSGEWVSDKKEFAVDRYGNEIVPTSSRLDTWYKETSLVDGSSLNETPMYTKLEQGDNEISIKVKSGSVFIGNVTVKSKDKLISYDEYCKLHASDNIYTGDLIKFGVENIYSKSSLDIRVYSLQDSTASRYKTTDKLLNAIFESSFNDGNDKVTWAIDIPEDGMYAISFKYLQDTFLDMPVERTIYINGKIPFEEVHNYYFYYTKRWANETLGNDDAYLFYFEKGLNYLTMEAGITIYKHAVEEIDRIMDEMSDMSLEIKYLTNGQTDTYRNWNITKYIPNLESELHRWADEIDQLRDYLKQYSAKDNYSSTFSNLKLAAQRLRKLAKEPDQIANKLTAFTDGSASVSQLLGNLILTFNSTPLGLEQIFIGRADAKLPKARENFFVKFFEGLKRFFASFFAKEYSINSAAADEVEVWVNRSRQYVEIMQQMADEEGLKVKFSIMPDENKLILANTSSSLPDVALSVSNWLIFNLALRGIVTDLRTYPNYEELVTHFSKGAMIPYAYEDGMYGLPETQDFWITYYRTDIYETLGLDVPKTWDELLGQLPILQRLGYNFYSPLSSYRGLKPYVAMLPMFYQFGAKDEYKDSFTGSLYASDGMSTTLSNEENVAALKFITNLFTIYDIPEETLSFYNSFRYGTLPIGIANSAVYTQLLIAAPEINGNWSTSLHLGVETASGNVCYSSAGSQGVTLFESSDKKEQAWEYISWWLSEKTQANFIQRLYGMYGLEYLWYSANLDAFETLPIDYNDKQVMLEQLRNHAIEASRIPAAYMLERSISDAYSKVVYNGVNARIAIDDAVIESNREIIRKNEEFGYMKNGKKVKDYIVPSIYNIDNWLKGREN